MAKKPQRTAEEVAFEALSVEELQVQAEGLRKAIGGIEADLGDYGREIHNLEAKQRQITEDVDKRVALTGNYRDLTRDMLLGANKRAVEVKESVQVVRERKRLAQGVLTVKKRELALLEKRLTYLALEARGKALTACFMGDFKGSIDKAAKVFDNMARDISAFKFDCAAAGLRHNDFWQPTGGAECVSLLYFIDKGAHEKTFLEAVSKYYDWAFSMGQFAKAPARPAGKPMVTKDSYESASPAAHMPEPLAPVSEPQPAPAAFDPWN